VRRAYAAELDATWETRAGAGVARAWLEGMLGTSWIAGRSMPCRGFMPCKVPILETRAIAAYRIGGIARRERYVEVYGQFGVLDPDRDTSDDHVIETSGGITYGAWEFWRVQAEASVVRFGDNAPLGIAEFATLPVNATRFLVQLGARL
jgi:hypothetical protein